MSSTEKDKDVSCFAVDGVVAEMVIEVEESQKIGSDDFKDMPNSPSKDNHCDKKCDDSKGAVVDKEVEKEFNVLDLEKEDKENSVEFIETQDKNENCIEDKKASEVNDHTVEEEKSDEINQSTEDKKSKEVNDQSMDNNKSNDVSQQNVKNNQNLKRKRKRGPTLNGNENYIKDADIPRYPGIKKRKTEVDSREKEEIKKDISNNVSTKKSVQTDEDDVNSIMESDTPKESDKANLSRSLRNRKTDVESEKSASKQNALRKLPFRKNKDAPDVPDLKPSVLWWNGVGEGLGVKLGEIPEIRERIEKAKSIRALYRVLFFQWPTNGQDLIGQILEFNGFPFDKSSYEFSKRQSIMKIMLDKTIFHMCELLDIRKGDKQSNIKNILEFLLRPYAKIDPAEDRSWQPVVVLERIELDDNFFDLSSSNINLRRGRSFNSSKNTREKNVKSTSASQTRATRSSGPRSIEIVLHPDPEKIPEKSKDDAKSNKVKLSTAKESNRSGGKSNVKPDIKENSSIIKDSKMNSSEIKKANSGPGIKDTKSKDIKTKTSLVAKDEKTKITSTVKDNKEKTAPIKKDVKSSTQDEKSKAEEIKSNVSNKLKRRRKFKKRKKINATSTKKVVEKEETSTNELKEDSDAYEIEMTIDSGPDMDNDIQMEVAEVKKPKPETVEMQEKSETVSDETTEETQKAVVSTVILSDSSETESAEETKLVTASKKAVKVPMKRKGKPLRHFTKISDSIQNANFSALQRLHILLFGASDKAENLKSNILSFGGFPFLEGSDEWKQKHFLLSLLAQNNLREYLNLLCIPYANDDQPTMISKLMRFLAVPSEESLEVKIQPIETEVVSSVLVDKSPPSTLTKVSKGETKKKIKKKEEKKVSKRPRKILMSEEEARRLEANFAREQRALAREKKLSSYYPLSKTMISQELNTATLNMHTYVPQPKSSVKPPVTDADQLNALLQTVYKRRALKAAGAVISTPNKGQKTRLGDIENIKFLIVTSNLSDLEILHRLIFMLEASKSRIRKNILDFEGFGFSEDSPKYKHRMDYLNSLGYEASKRISFLLGLCPLNTNLPQQDLNELIMYFLMSPCKTKQTVPITQMPTDEPHIIVKSTAPLENPIYIHNSSLTKPVPTSKNSKVLKKASSNDVTIQHSTPIPKTGTQKAKKTFPSSSKVSPVKKVLLPPSQSPVLGIKSLGNKSQKMTLLNSIPAVPAYSIPKSTVPNPLTNVTLLNTGSLLLNAPKSPVNSVVKVPVVNSSSKIQILNQNPKVAVIDPASAKIPVSLSNVSGQVLQNQILIPQISNKGSVPHQVQTPLLHGSKMIVKSPTGVASPQEFIVQQQTPDGQQKTFKLIRLPPNHPLVSNVGNKPPVQQTVSSPQLQQQVLLTNAPLSGNIPPGLVIMKNNASLPQTQNLQILPNAPVKIWPPSTTSSSVSPVVSTLPSKITLTQTEENVSANEKESISASGNTSLDNSMEVTSSSEDNPPTDEDLFSSIQEIILSSNFEDITLRNVIERVAAQYPDHDLTHRHNYMKECVKKIIIGT